MENKYRPKLAGKSQEIIEKYLGGLSITKLGKEYDVAGRSILMLLRKNNIQMRKQQETRLLWQGNHTIINCLDHLNGWLLGDGWLDNKGGQARFGLGSMHKEYIEYAAGLLGETLECKTYKRKGFNFYTLYTPCTLQLKELYNKWYPAPNRKKIVPTDLVLTSNTMVNWIMDDGCLENRSALELATCAFSNEECQILSKKISDFIGDVCGNKIGIGYVCANKKRYNTIQINRIDYITLLDKIGKCPVECFNYKWDVNRDARIRISKDLKNA